MNVTSTFGFSALGTSLGAFVPAALGRATQHLRQAPLLVWSLVVAAALLAFFVHLLNVQVQRGELLREEQRAAALRPSSQSASPPHADHQLVVTRQPMTRP